MTLEHRLFVTLGDIRAVTFECKRCQVRLSLAPESIKANDLVQCPACALGWLSDDVHSGRTPISETLLFLLCLASARKAQTEKGDTAVGVRILLEFEAPHAKS